MALTNIHMFSGGVTIRSAPPGLEVVDHAIYVPFSRTVYFDRDPGWGLYHDDGSLVDAAAYRRDEPPVLIGQSPRISVPLADIAEAPDADYLYAGPLITHFGHYMVSSLCRLWPIVAAGLGRRKLLFHAAGKPADWFERGFVRDSLSALGITPEDCASFDRPVRLRRVVVPWPAFSEGRAAHRIFAEVGHRIGQVLNSKAAIPSAGPPIYLSKTRLRSGVHKLLNEQELIDALTARTELELVYPEELDLAQQAAIFASGRLVIGPTSSAFHTSILSSTKPRLLVISPRRSLPSNFRLIDLVNENRASYVYPESGYERREREGSFQEVFVARDIRGLAADLAVMIGRMQSQVGVTGWNDAATECVPDHAGPDYRRVLTGLHESLKPKAYLEIAALTDKTLQLAQCASISINPQMIAIPEEGFGAKPACAFYRMSADAFFADYDPERILGRPIDLCFLDGVHLCDHLLRDFINVEKFCDAHAVIVLHDCLPVEHPMADRNRGRPAILPQHGGWWTGDIWRTVLALKKHRPDLRIAAFDAAPTGLVVITNLDRFSSRLADRYDAIVAEMMSWSLEDIGIRSYFRMLGVQSADRLPAWLLEGRST
jgi:hypothetical protein